MNSKKNERKSVLNDSQFWDRLVKGLFITGLAIIIIAVALKYFEIL